MQIEHAIDKKTIWMVRSGSGSFALNKLNHPEYKVGCAEGDTSKHYRDRFYFLAIMTLLLQIFGGIGGVFC